MSSASTRTLLTACMASSLLLAMNGKQKTPKLSETLELPSLAEPGQAAAARPAGLGAGVPTLAQLGSRPMTSGAKARAAARVVPAGPGAFARKPRFRPQPTVPMDPRASLGAPALPAPKPSFAGHYRPLPDPLAAKYAAPVRAATKPAAAAAESVPHLDLGEVSLVLDDPREGDASSRATAGAPRGGAGGAGRLVRTLSFRLSDSQVPEQPEAARPAPESAASSTLPDQMDARYCRMPPNPWRYTNPTDAEQTLEVEYPHGNDNDESYVRFQGHPEIIHILRREGKTSLPIPGGETIQVGVDDGNYVKRFTVKDTKAMAILPLKPRSEKEGSESDPYTTLLATLP
jgi:hypothetical protein